MARVIDLNNEDHMEAARTELMSDADRRMSRAIAWQDLWEHHGGTFPEDYNILRKRYLAGVIGGPLDGDTKTMERLAFVKWLRNERGEYGS